MKVRDLMTTGVKTCTPDTSLLDVAKIMADVNCGGVPVVQGNRVMGMVTDRDIVLRCVAKGQEPSGMKASDCMSKEIVTATPDMDIHEAADLMASRQIRRLPIVEGDRVTGILALGDMATINIHVNEAGDALSEISEPASPGAH